ncbi:uncharacterized protein LOC114260504 [Camellia sinensis]|uniref:uncharacterized protein LOC114260504 n=1 Tax=Camellia sinensis TaxID=4442 RepID=UPI0010360C37|nr:uncharacterized protein LOC114260504 [Camellia sinensis]
MASNSLYDMLVNDSDFSESDDDLEMLKAVTMDEELLDSEIESSSCRGSVRGRKVIHRDHIEGHERFFLDYFAELPVYPPELFRRRFRMKRSLFLRIQAAVEAHDPYFLQKRNCAGKLVVDIFSNEYLRSPNSNDIAKLLAVGESRGFPGMLESIDCMHWKWKNCPTALKCMYTSHIHEPTIILEAVASYDLWIWHAFFGLPGSHNDINVLERSFVFTELAQRRAPAVNYTINGNEHTMG